MKLNLLIKIIFSFLLFVASFAQASTAPKCSAVLMFQKQEVQAKVTAIVKTILTYQMSSANGILIDNAGFTEATRQINEIVNNLPEMLEFYHTEMARLAKNDSSIKTKVKKVADDQKVLEQKVQFEDSVVVIEIDNKPHFIFKKNDGSYFVIGENKEFLDYFSNQKNIQQVLSNKTYSAIAILKNDGSVLTWGHKERGGDSSLLNLTNIKTIYSTHNAFAALKNDGSVLTWGSKDSGGDSSSLNLTNVKSIFSSGNTFVALKRNSSAITWGDTSWSGKSTQINFSKGKAIISTAQAFAVLKNDGSVVTWGEKDFGGYSSHLDLTNIQSIYATKYAFAALKNDGSVVTWGGEYYGGNSSKLKLAKVKSIFSTDEAFVALKNDGSVLTWGKKDSGGDSSPVQNQLYDIVNIIEIKTGSFLAIRKDGKYILWGRPIGEFKDQVLDFDLM